MWHIKNYSLLLHKPAAHALMLAIILACQLMLVLDGTVVYAALPHILTELNFSRADLSWVHNSYLLAFGGCMLLGARTGDILGYRYVFIAGVAAFTVASCAGGLAPSALCLLVARALQGIAAAFAAPAALALLMHIFPQGPTRLRALGLYTAVSGAGSAIGLVLGGILTDLLSWRSVFFINLPIGMILLIVAPLYLPHTLRASGRFDILGTFSATLGMGLLAYALVCSASYGFGHAPVVFSLLAGFSFIVFFIWIERRALQPILPLSLFDSSERTGAYIGKMLLIGGMLGTFFFLTQFVQNGLGYSAFQAGLAFVPLSIAQFFMVMAGVPRLLPRLGGRGVLVLGLSVALVGMLCLSQVDIDTHFFPDLVFPIVLLGIGTGAALVPLASTGLAGVRGCDAGAASGVINVTHYLGGALGTAIIVACTRLFNIVSISTSARAVAYTLAVAARVSVVFFLLALLIALVTMRRPVVHLIKA